MVVGGGEMKLTRHDRHIYISEVPFCSERQKREDFDHPCYRLLSNVTKYDINKSQQVYTYILSAICEKLVILLA